MPCYTAWNEYLKPGTPEYLTAEEIVRAKLKAVQHIVDYYYEAFDQRIPRAETYECTSMPYEPASLREKKLLEIICHHFSCDGIHFTMLYDVRSVLECRKGGRAYDAIITYCASLMRAERGRYQIRSQDKDI